MVEAVILALMLMSGPYDSRPNCKIMYQAPSDRWRFIKVYEVSSGQVVLQTVISGGRSRDVYVASPSIRIDSKWAGDVAYRPGLPVSCAHGATIKI